MATQLKRFLTRALLLVFMVSSSNLHALDLTPFYRVAHFQGDMPKTDLRDGTSYLTASYFEGNTKSSWNRKEDRTSLFNDRGPFDLTKLGLNLEGLDPATKPLTHKFLRGPNPEDETDIGEFTVLGSKGLGKFRFAGCFSMQEVNLEFRQNLAYGFYAMVHVPLRDLNIGKINFTPVGKAPTAAVTEPNTDTDQEVYANFLNDLDSILAENDLCPVKTPYHKSGVSDVVAALGWQGYETDAFDYLVTSMQGYMQIGVLFPAAQAEPLDKVFFVPLGYYHQWGIDTRVGLQLNLFDYFAVGAHAGVTIFWNETHARRVRTSFAQRGWINLECAPTTKEQGNVWNLGAYAKADHIIGGFSAALGYSLTKQEQSFLIPKSCDYLRTLTLQRLNEDPPSVTSRINIASSDCRLRSWKQHIMHVFAEYDFGAHVDQLLLPQLQFKYSFALAGSHSWPAEMIGGTIQVVLSWTT